MSFHAREGFGHSRPIPRDEDAFSYDPEHLREWCTPSHVWEALPRKLKDEITKVQHAGAAALTSLARLQEMDDWRDDQTECGMNVANLCALDRNRHSFSRNSTEIGDESYLSEPFPSLYSALSADSQRQGLHAGTRCDPRIFEMSPPYTPRSGSETGLSALSRCSSSRRTSRSHPSGRRSSNLSIGSPPPPSPIDPYTLKPVNIDPPPTSNTSLLPSPMLSPSVTALQGYGFILPASPVSPASPDRSFSPTPKDTEATSPNRSAPPETSYRKPSSSYLAEVAHLRSDCLVRLRHAVRLVEREYNEICRAALVQPDTESANSEAIEASVEIEGFKEFDLWWDTTKITAQELVERGQRLAEDASEASRAANDDEDQSVVGELAGLEV